MASQWRGGPPDIKGTLGTLLRTTLHQAGVVKDAAVRQARTQRVWLDGAVLARKRREILADLGERVVELARSGALGDTSEWPELREGLAELDDIDARIEEAGGADEAEPAVSAWPPQRGRFDRGRPARREEELRVWRPVRPQRTGGAPEDERPEPAAGGRGGRRGARRAPATGGGGIEFVDDPVEPGGDDDLGDYMHEDDVRGPERED